MTVKQLIETLQRFHEDLEVVVYDPRYNEYDPVASIDRRHLLKQNNGALVAPESCHEVHGFMVDVVRIL